MVVNHSTLRQALPEAAPQPPVPETPSRAVACGPTLRGCIVEELTGIPLGGVLVQWVVPTQPGAASTTGHTLVLGAAVSSDDGAFEITPMDTPEAGTALCRLRWEPAARSSVRLDGRHEPVDYPVEALGDAEALVAVGGSGEPDHDAWRSVADYLAANRMLRADELARQLSAPWFDSPVTVWPAHLRAGALAALQRTLGPAAEAPLLEQEHLVSLDPLREGNLPRALNEYRDATLYVEYGGKLSDWLDGSFFRFAKSDLELYRDYLRGVWLTAARRMHTLRGAPVPSDAALGRQLDARFHQDFLTRDTRPQPVHRLLIPILREVLTTPADREGFGRDAAALPAQGTQSDARYLATLIALSDGGPDELRNRFRIRFDRRPDELASPVELNVEALLGILADTYQSPEEPFAVQVRGLDGRPFLFPPAIGRAPFFLHQQEWLERQRRFYPENVYDIRRALPIFDKTYRDQIAAQKRAPWFSTSPNNDYIANQADWQASAAWLERVFAIVDEIRAALAAADTQAYAAAQAQLDATANHIVEARRASATAWRRDRFVWWDRNGNLNTPADQRVSLKARAARPVARPAELAEFEAYFDPRTTPYVASWQNMPGPDYGDWLESWLARARTLYLNQLDYLGSVLIPYVRATLFVTLGDRPRALQLLGQLTGYPVGVAQATDPAGYRAGSSVDDARQLLLYADGSLPYTTGLSYDTERRAFADGPLAWNMPPLAPFERRFFKLAQAEVMLAWADELYRTDEAASIHRARELYKGVLFLHGEDPEIAPSFSVPGQLRPWPALGPLLPPLLRAQTNPARASQLARARTALAQIELGLNAYGYHPDMVPVLRYTPLKQAADRFALGARSAQADFLQYQTRFEQATIEAHQTAAMVKRAEASLGIATEQVEIARAGVAKAEEQVAQVKAQVDAKRQEIADADDFFHQASDFFGGLKDSLGGMVSQARKVAGDSSPASAVTGDQLVDLLAKSTGGASAARDAAVATLGSGAALAIGFGAFAVTGYTTMEGMAVAASKRQADLDALERVALPAAEAQVRLKERDVAIARYQGQAAQAELDLARELDRYQRERFLNVDLWNQLSALAQRTMRRYVELGARAGWLAERGLAFEQARDIRIMRLNYASPATRGLGAADRLLLDLAELEATRVQGVRLTTPIKHTLSLAREFPLAFARLKQTGRCTFHTREGGLRTAYPGTRGYRLRAVSVAAQDASGPPPRGILRNLGASVVSHERGLEQVLIRFPDALPLSEFRLHDDLFVYGLPGETLLQFEGSGFETDWELELPAAANPRGLRSLVDVLIVCDMNATYSQSLAAHESVEPAPAVNRALAMAASAWDPDGLARLRATAGPARISFDLTCLALSAHERNRRITNLALLAVGKTDLAYSATLATSQSPTTQVAFQITDGVALSNAGLLLGTRPPMPLNALVDLPVDQTVILEIDRTGAAEELAGLFDVVLYLEYRADT